MIASWIARVATRQFAVAGGIALADTMESETVFASLPVLRIKTPKKKNLVSFNLLPTSPTLLAAALPMSSCPLGIAALAQR